ncbi:30S ribosomal protein S20 [Petrotoga sp. 9PWA.NaAc.5.4]|uniref:30S ribosomal protein S20 n=1 Tax=Petrotoga sp. 9PWA.NaAc.5.4 TaxID=1434328 RepID=UPI000CAA8000|nr:30S ribosomal protein S20 [Petrotoga sp. 9PWA.NaAc.5.4]PNR94183.1 30S ribosomal protein S20 [Petrotoga sp. 9PWA.NaAc.5.4]
MPNTKSAKKRAKQSEIRRNRNRGYLKRIKEVSKELEKSISQNADKEQVNELLRKAFKTIDKAKSKGVVHRNYAARKKSSLHIKVKKYLGELAPEAVNNTVETSSN